MLKKSRTLIFSPKSFWAFLALSGLAYESRSLKVRDGGTASEATRAGLFVHTNIGRWVFLIGWGTLTSWFSAHIIAPVLKDIYEEEDRLRSSRLSEKVN